MLTRYNPLLLFLFLFLSTSIVTGQNKLLDSLINLYPQIEDERKQVDIINKIGYRFYMVDIEKTLEYGQKGLDLSEKIDYPMGKGMALNVLSIYHDVNGDIEKSLALDKQVLEIGESIKDDFLISVACTNMANKYDTKGEPQKAISLYQRAIDISERTEDVSGQILGFANLGLLYRRLNEVENTNLYFQKAKKILDQYPEKAMYCWFYSILGDWHFKNKDNDKAEQSYNRALTESTKRNDKRAIANLNLSLSKLYLATNLTERAEQSLRIAIETTKLIGDKSLTLTAEIGLLEHYLETEQLGKANTLGNNLLAIAQEHKFTAFEMQIYRSLVQIHVKKENYKKGYELNQDYLRLKDSLFSEEKKIEVAEIEEKYQSKIREKENVLLRAEQAEQRNLLASQRKLGLALIAIIFLLSIIGLLIYLAYKAQKSSKEELEQKVIDRTKELSQSNKELEKSNEELERFAFIASHDLKEPLRSISGFTQLLQRKLPTNSSPSINECISYITKGTKQMHTLIEGVLDYSRVTQKSDEMVVVELNTVINEIKESLATTIDEKQAIIIVNNDLSRKKLNATKIYFLFKNLMENAIKFNQSEIPEVQIGCNEVEGQLIYYVSDNGIGIDQDYRDVIFEMFKRLHNRADYEGSGLGLSVCKKIVEELGGRIWIDSQKENGTTFYFTLEPSELKGNESSTHYQNSDAALVF